MYYVDPSGHICDPAAQKIMEKLASNQATRNEQKKLAAYLRNKDRHGGLTDAERGALQQVDSYTYLPRYENQTLPWKNNKGESKSGSGSLNEETFTRYLADGRQVTDVTNLPGSTGIQMSRRLTTDEMTFLTQEYGVEFAQV